MDLMQHLMCISGAKLEVGDGEPPVLSVELDFGFFYVVQDCGNGAEPWGLQTLCRRSWRRLESKHDGYFGFGKWW